MRRYLTIGITGTGAAEILHGAEKSLTQHRDEFRKLGSGKKKEAGGAYAEVQVIDLSKGIVKRKRYGTSKFKGAAADGKRTVARSVGAPIERPAPRPKKSKNSRAAKPAAPVRKPAPKKAAAQKPPDEGTFPKTGDGPQLV